MKHKTIYLAGPLFTVAQQTHNLRLERELIALGYQVILPQRRALEFVTQDGLDLDQMAEDCAQFASDKENIFVANLDGPDTDSGTAVEYGLAIAGGGRAIVYRTDIRTAPEKEVGVNAMLRLKNTTLILMPCNINSEDQIHGFYVRLANAIHKAIVAG